MKKFTLTKRLFSVKIFIENKLYAGCNELTKINSAKITKFPEKAKSTKKSNVKVLDNDSVDLTSSLKQKNLKEFQDGLTKYDQLGKKTWTERWI